MIESKLFKVLIGDSDLLLCTEEHLVILREPALSIEVVKDDVLVITGGGPPHGFWILPVNQGVEINMRA